MPTPRLTLTLTLLLILALGVSCSPQPTPNLNPSNGQSPTSAPTLPIAAPEATRKPKVSQAPQTFPTSSYAPAASDFNLILGRPTTNSITASLYSKSDLQVVIAYGTASGNYTLRSNQIALKALTPQNVEFSNLQPDTEYFYSVLANGASSVEHTFHTQRSAGGTFTFTIDADPHNRDPRFNGELYAITLNNALADHPDFHIDLGDTFMTEKVQAKTYAEAASTFTDMRPYFGIIGADAPLFLVNGNHEGELGWLLTRGSDTELPIWSTQLRQLYYPNPTPNNFYSGASSVDSNLGGLRDGYYSWTWGDALFVVLDPFWYTASKPQPDDLNNNWNWTLGKEQYDWLKSTLETSDAKFKFVFIHNLVGGNNTDGRGGIEAVPYFEWGGNNADGSYGFDEHRPGWGVPIHQLLITNRVSAVFHGHDHVFVKQDLDGIVYQEVPQPSNAQPDNTNLAAEYGYVNGKVVAGSGHLRVTVTPEQVTVEFIRAYLERSSELVFTYSIP
jgi:hypothetical protein